LSFILLVWFSLSSLNLAFEFYFISLVFIIKFELSICLTVLACVGAADFGNGLSSRDLIQMISFFEQKFINFFIDFEKCFKYVLLTVTMNESGHVGLSSEATV